MKQKHFYTKEQMDKAVELYETTKMKLDDIAKECGIPYGAYISKEAKRRGLPTRLPEYTKGTGITKSKKFVRCPACGKKFELRDGQHFCHLCGADITPLDEKCKSHLADIYSFINSNLSNPYTLQHQKLVDTTKELLDKLKDAQEDLSMYFSK